MNNNIVKKKKIIISIIIVGMFLVFFNIFSFSYVIDGFLSDWGIDLNLATQKGYLDTHLPNSSANVDYVTEDNADSKNTWQEVGPGWTYGNYFDAEAIYFDNDSSYGYIAIVQGLPKTGYQAPGNPLFLPGDIAIDIDNNNIYEYGISITNSHLYLVGSWNTVYYTQYNISNPWRIKTTLQDLGPVDLVYSSNQNNHYVIEAKIPLSLLNLTYGDYLNIHWTQQCGNDYLNLRASVNPIPEPNTFLLFIFGILSFLLQSIKNFYKKFRRVTDFIVSLFLLILFSPLMLIIAILIKLDSPGPIFYKQVRVGLNRRRNNTKEINPLIDRRKDNKLGRLFTMYKFRTMYVDAESKTGPIWAKENDPRVTRIGKILRKTRLDELPQLINVIKGDMSLIGPRPERPEFVKDLNNNIKCYYLRYNIKPGITGLAQIKYRYTSSLEETKKKLRYDLFYIKRMCFLLDLNILFNTFLTVVSNKGAR